MENTASHSSCISRPASVSAGEMHFAGFLAPSAHSDQEMDLQGRGGGASESSFSYFFYSLGDDDDDPFITSDMVCDDQDEDDSLQDTACSSAAGLKVTTMNDMFMKSMVTMDAEEMNTSQLAKNFLDEDSQQQVNGAVQKVISGANSNDKQLYEGNDLRKRGFCLVPLSMLKDYLG
ncbi:unnamed protein product [Alopecurus aequalis]